MAHGVEGHPHIDPPRAVSIAEPEKTNRELPEAVRTLTEVRTGDAVYVVGPDYTRVHWDSQMESLSGVLSEDALGKRCYEAVMGESEGGEPFLPTAARLCTLPRKGALSPATR